MWKLSTQHIERYVYCQHATTKELCLFGKYGEIWPVARGKYSVLVKGNLKKKVADILNLKVSVGSQECELVARFSSDKLSLIASMIKVPVWPDKQLEIANAKTS